MPVRNSDSRKEFFDRFSYENFCRFYKIETQISHSEEKVLGNINFETGYKNGHPRNLIVFGAPGTGKSFTINEECKKLITNENKEDYERVTFHPNYSYSNFVGTYKPVSDTDSEGKDVIKYEYVPGPFMRILVKALENSKNEISKVRPFLLIIEEINRANVAAVFGEVFQLLDRNSNNVSEYSINPSEDVKKYLIDKLHVTEEEIRELKLPDNMFIWATMNSADQGVYLMDTAFKRRWEFQYIGIDDEADKVKDYIIPIGNKENRKYVYWNEIRMKINDILLSENCKVNEDKLLGPFFMSKSVLESAISDEISEEYFIKAFESKVIMYLFEDVMKMRPQNIFRGHDGKWIFSEICSDFEINREKVFDIKDLNYVGK
jgi:5-methylcytosine-specific restriction endonuclease McrBC GTP-binding regulatory subunit McrB